MKKMLLSLALLIASVGMSAQTVSTHTVQRGETIESVAKKYGVSVEELKKANPSTSEYFYAGMKLNIPVKKVSTVTTPKTNNNVVSTNNTTRTSTKKTTKTSSIKDRVSNFVDSSMDGSDFINAGITFGSDFSDLVGMTYGIQGQYFLKNNIGATLNVGANYGIEDNPDIVIKVGPSYVYPIKDWLYVMGTACYTLTIAEYKGNSGTISGACLIPTVGFAINQFRIGVNGELRWRNGGSFGGGAFISAGYAF